VIRTNRALPLVFLTLGWVGPWQVEAAARLVPLGPEVELSSFDPGKPLLAAQPGGESVIAWDETHFPGGISYYHVAAGSVPPSDQGPSGFESPVDLALALRSVTATPNGFDLIWHPRVDEEPRVFYRSRVDPQGTLVDEPVRVGGGGTDWVWHLGAEQLLSGWVLPRAHGIGARRQTSAGAPVGSPLRLNTRPVNGPEAEVVPLTGGGFVAVWLGAVPGSPATKVLRARRFSSAGRPQGRDFDVSSILGSLRAPFVVAAAPGGGFAIAWMLDSTLYLRSFDAVGRPLGREAPVAAGEGIVGPESMAFNPAGNLLLLWQVDHGLDLRLRLFDRQGSPRGSGIRVSSEPIDVVEPREGSVAWAGDSWLVTWRGAPFPFDFSVNFARRFTEE
jgi:hypothetical protein